VPQTLKNVNPLSTNFDVRAEFERQRAVPPPTPKTIQRRKRTPMPDHLANITTRGNFRAKIESIVADRIQLLR
jgi:hypothetical protein